jgi:hypothetical protein
VTNLVARITPMTVPVGAHATVSEMARKLYGAHKSGPTSSPLALAEWTTEQ